MKGSDPNLRASIPGRPLNLAAGMKQLFTFVPQPSMEASAEFRISIRSLPFLADHAFQGVVVLPGSFYLEMALSVQQELSQRAPGVIRNVTFQNPIMLSSEDTTLLVEVRNRNATTSEYTFYECVVGKADATRQHHAARLEIDRIPSGLQESVEEPFSIEAFQVQAREVIDSERFYETLRANGNQYGPRFRCVSSIWRAGNQSLGRLSSERTEGEPRSRRPALLDSMTQLLAPSMMARGRTFILRSIERIEIASLDFPNVLWCHGTLLPEDGGDSDRVVGDIRVFDSTGKMYLRLSGVAFILMDRPEAPEGSRGPTLVVASNFTAEPVEDSLKFWAAHFNLLSKIEFAPYDQVFQQLLQTESAFRRNRAGVNIILLQLERWAPGERDAVPDFDESRAERGLREPKRCVLPNGLEIVHLNQYETDYLYKEIFEDECYLKHDIRLPDGATVLDIGANIGMFSLFVMSRCRNPRIYAFEPAPVAFDLLNANCSAYGSCAQAFNFGVSNRQGTATFTFYENSSVFSGFHSDEAEDGKAIRAVVRNMLKAESETDESVQEYLNEFTKDRLRRSTHECRMTTVSDIIRQNQIESIDLLKIDAEKSELEIIQGIADCDWPKIDQIVIEIHDPTGDVVRGVNELLVRRGYRCAIEQEKLLEHSGLFNLFATRDETGNRMRSDSEDFQAAAALRQTRRLPGSLKRNVRDFCAALKSFTSQTSAPVVLCFCPATPRAQAHAELKAALDEAERELLSWTSTLEGVSTIDSQTLLRRYPVAEYHDVHGHQLGDIPYTSEGYTAIGTALFRTIFNLKRRPFKVTVLDCDNTLWKGVCGENGWQGVAVTEPHRALQQFMIGQMNLGMLLCLCSKNREQDVLDVFDRHADMLLKREHLASWRINWSSKSENIKSLASELNIGLDSFIFIDDNPVDCADVEINCPQVLSLRLPRDPASFASFCGHIWAFDHTGTTKEDRNRVRMYRDNTQRERFRAETPSLNDFIAGLMVRVEIDEATDDQLSRISQLTFRTNQFNFTTIRRSPREIKEFLKRKDAGCLAVRVADRFGDYGLVGVVLYQAEALRFTLDTFLLSCRVLGRGVEHFLLSNIGQRALRAGKRYVELSCLPTERNLPAREFVGTLGEQYRNEAGTAWLFPAEYLAGLEYHPDEKTQQSNDEPATPQVEKPALPPPSGFSMTARSEHLQGIGEQLYDISQIAKAIDEFRVRGQGLDGAVETEPSESIESTLVNIWRRVLGQPGIGLNANFFEVGGTSLKAVQVIAMIRKELKANLSIVNLFECPTISLLAAKLCATGGNPSSGASTSGAALRGQQRRSKAMRRTKNR